MKTHWAACLLGGILLTVLTAVAPADDATDEAIKKDRKQIEGTWRAVTLEVNGNKAMDEDAKKITVVNGSDGTWSVRVDGKEISKGTSTFNPAKKLKSMDFTPTEGEGKDNQYLAIYELGQKTRKVCIAPVGKERPKEFSSTPGSDFIHVKIGRAHV